jgi:hypothetical protein
MKSLSKLLGRGSANPVAAGQRSLFNFSSAASNKREGMQATEDHEVGSGGEAGNFKHMAKTGEGIWSAAQEEAKSSGGVGEPGVPDDLATDEIIHESADPSVAGTEEELQEEDFAAEADWRRLGNETAAGPSVFDHERPHHILHQGFHGPPPEDSHIHREDLKDSDSSNTP